MKKTLALFLFLGAMAMLLLQMRGYFDRNPLDKAFKRKHAVRQEQYTTDNATTTVDANASSSSQNDVEENSQGDPILGSWKIIKSFNLNGGTYEGGVKFTKKGSGYHLQWHTNGGSYEGVALKNGKNLFVGWGSGNYGMVAYKINKDGTLSGEWLAAKSRGNVGTEDLTGGVANKLAGTYQVKGQMNEKGYQGGLIIKKTGNVYQLEWINELAGQRGVAIKVGDYLVAGWGSGATFGVVNYTINGNQMLGRWTIGAADREGIENLQKIK